MYEHIAVDCRLFDPQRPCLPHKERGQLCQGCPDYAPATKRVVIIKLGALGDVLRTTSLLAPLEAAHGPMAVSWITHLDAMPLLAGNPLIQRVLPWDHTTAAILASEHFDLALGLDNDVTGAAITSLVTATRVLGFSLDAAGLIQPGNPAAARWHTMGLRDDLKRANTATYQRILLDMCDLPEANPPRPRLHLSEDEQDRAAHTLTALGHRPTNTPLIGLNVGAGARWPTKHWSMDAMLDLTRRIAPTAVLLLGGPSEARALTWLTERAGDHVIACRPNTPLRDFAALIDHCDVIVTADSLALHIATAREVPVVALFGPTSQSEIELYGSGIKLAPAGLDCLGCYHATCPRGEACTQRIEPSAVQQAITALLHRSLQ